MPKNTAVKLTEKQITELVKGFLEAKGWVYIRLQSGLLRTKDNRFMRVGKAGLPDAVAVKGCHESGYSRTLFLEFKRSKGGKVSEHQELWHLLAKNNKLIVLVVDDFGEFKKQYGEIYFPAGYDATEPIGSD